MVPPPADPEKPEDEHPEIATVPIGLVHQSCIEVWYRNGHRLGLLNDDVFGDLVLTGQPNLPRIVVCGDS